MLLSFFFCSSLKPQTIMQMLESFFKFVLQDPKVAVNQIVRQELVTGLLQTASTLLRCPGAHAPNNFIITLNYNNAH